LVLIDGEQELIDAVFSERNATVTKKRNRRHPRRTIPAHSMARTRLVELLEIRLFVPNEPIELYRFDGREIFWSRIDRIRSSDGIEIDAVFSRLPHAKHQVVGACGIVTGYERWFPRSVQSGQIELPT